MSERYDPQLQKITKASIQEMLDAGPDTSAYIIRVFDVVVRTALTLQSHCLQGGDMRCTLDHWEAPH